MSVTVRLVEGLRCEAAAGEHTVTLDEPVDRGGTGAGMTPKRMLLASLGGCTAITLRMYSERKGWPLEGCTVRVLLDEPPRTSGEPVRFTMDVQLDGPLDEDQRAPPAPDRRALPGAPVPRGRQRLRGAPGGHRGHGERMSGPHRELLEVFDNPAPGRSYEIIHTAHEFTSVCPITGHPDFAEIDVRYVADERCIELQEPEDLPSGLPQRGRLLRGPRQPHPGGPCLGFGTPSPRGEGRVQSKGWPVLGRRGRSPGSRPVTRAHAFG